MNKEKKELTIQELKKNADAIKDKVVIELGKSIIKDLKSTPCSRRHTLKIKLEAFLKIVKR